MRRNQFQIRNRRRNLFPAVMPFSCAEEERRRERVNSSRYRSWPDARIKRTRSEISANPSASREEKRFRFGKGRRESRLLENTMAILTFLKPWNENAPTFIRILWFSTFAPNTFRSSAINDHVLQISRTHVKICQLITILVPEDFEFRNSWLRVVSLERRDRGIN